MKNQKKKKVTAVRLATGLLTVGMLTNQPILILAAEGDNIADVADTGLPASAIQAKTPETGELVSISETVQGLLDDGSIFLDETTRYLYDVVTGQIVNPTTGERVENTQKPENPDPDSPKPEEQPDDPVPGTPDSGTGKTENGVQEATPTPEATVTPDPENVGADGENKSTNEELVSRQQIVELPVIENDFRFWTVARKYAFAKKDISIREEMSADSREIGRLSENGLLFVLKENYSETGSSNTEAPAASASLANGWVYVESGTVRGFVKEDEILTGPESKTILKKYQRLAERRSRKDGADVAISEIAPLAQELVPGQENEAYTYLRATVNQTVTEKDYALVTADRLNIRESKGIDGRIVGIMKKNSLCFILADKDDEWVYIESGDVRGFVKKEYLSLTVKEQVEAAGEDTFPTAEETIAPEENNALYYTLTSVKPGVPGGELRASVLEFAAQFIGNPYIWGGTSLTSGADCSGFVQSIYGQYGIALPRTSASQSQYGTQIPVSDAQPGDLIFYAKDGIVYHVAIYAGDGKTIEAMSEVRGIVQGTVNMADAVWATRILDDNNYTYASENIEEANAAGDMYGNLLGSFEVNYCCSCDLCCESGISSTAAGAPILEGQTIAVNPDVMPYGTEIIVDGHIYLAADCGINIGQDHVSIYVNSHEKALELNSPEAKKSDVYLVK